MGLEKMGKKGGGKDWGERPKKIAQGEENIQHRTQGRTS